MLVGAVLPLTGRYAVQGAQAKAGIELWARGAGAAVPSSSLLRDGVVVEDDGSDRESAVHRFRALLDRCDFVLPPYGSDSTRAVAAACPEAAIWNHGSAADDVQRLPNVVSLPSPASRYLVALGAAVASLRPGAVVAIVAARGRFAEYARGGLEREASRLGLHLAGTFSLDEAPAVAGSRPDVVLACGPAGREVRALRALRETVPDAILGGVSPGLAAFPDLLGADPEGLLAPVQWHPDLGDAPELGPPSRAVLGGAAAAGYAALDYVAAQAYAAALVATHCLALAPDDPLDAARRLRTSTFFGRFELDPESGIQSGHRLSVVRWHAGRRELVLPEAA